MTRSRGTRTTVVLAAIAGFLATAMIAPTSFAGTSVVGKFGNKRAACMWVVNTQSVRNLGLNPNSVRVVHFESKAFTECDLQPATSGTGLRVDWATYATHRAALRSYRAELASTAGYPIRSTRHLTIAGFVGTYRDFNSASSNESFDGVRGRRVVHVFESGSQTTKPLLGSIPEVLKRVASVQITKAK